MEKLKPCPFCGGEAEIAENYGGDFGIFHSGDEDCPLYCEEGETAGAWVWDTEEEARNAWDRRATAILPEWPPLGLKPKFIHDAQRLLDIEHAILRRVSAQQPIFSEWITEYNELISAGVRCEVSEVTNA